MGDTVEELLVALQDERIKEAIRSIVFEAEREEQEEQELIALEEVSQEEVEQLRLANQALEEEKEQLQKTMNEKELMHRNELQILAKEAAQEREQLKQKLLLVLDSEQKQQQKAEAAQQKVQYYEKNYRKLEEVYRIYCSLSAELHQELDRVLCADSAELFLAWGSQWDNLEALWDFLSYRVRELEEDERIALCDVFDYLFEVYQKVSLSYERLNASVGDEFDEDIHTRGANSAVGGTITKVLLQGYRGIHKGKIKKSIVLI